VRIEYLRNYSLDRISIETRLMINVFPLPAEAGRAAVPGKRRARAAQARPRGHVDGTAARPAEEQLGVAGRYGRRDRYRGKTSEYIILL